MLPWCFPFNHVLLTCWMIYCWISVARNLHIYVSILWLQKIIVNLYWYGIVFGNTCWQCIWKNWTTNSFLKWLTCGVWPWKVKVTRLISRSNLKIAWNGWKTPQKWFSANLTIFKFWPWPWDPLCEAHALCGILLHSPLGRITAWHPLQCSSSCIKSSEVIFVKSIIQPVICNKPLPHLQQTVAIIKCSIWGTSSKHLQLIYLVNVLQTMFTVAVK